MLGVPPTTGGQSGRLPLEALPEAFDVRTGLQNVQYARSTFPPVALQVRWPILSCRNEHKAQGIGGDGMRRILIFLISHSAG